MFTRILSPLSAEPNLALNRAYVRRTSLARLSIVYQIQPQYSGANAARAATALPQNNALAYSEVLNNSWSHAQLELTRNLGQGLYLDSIIMGGVDGESLPVTLDGAAQSEIAAHLPGGLIDVSG
jgi:hypothetical protein